MVDPPHGSSGPSALYGYRHLLQLVAVKVLQSHFLPIRKIRETIEDLADRELETLIGNWAMERSPLTAGVADAEASSESRHYLGVVADPPARDAVMSDLKHVRDEGFSAKAYLESLDGRPAASPLAGRVEPLGLDREGRGDREERGWVRHELYAGIELHVREGIRIPISPSFLSALASRMKSILEKLILRK